MRLDNYLVINNYFQTRNKAQIAIKSNRVLVNNIVINKSGYEVKNDDSIEIKQIDYEFVSRGGYKLLKAIQEFTLDFNDKIVMDLGASTGGFTDCSLQFGAKKVYAIDVGTNQLDKSLLNNNKVISLENLNVKDINANNFKDIDYIVIDVSFISLTKLITKIDELMINENINLITLIKPQFETQNENINKNGVVRNKDVHYSVIINIIKSFENNNIYINNLTFSPLKGEKSGNIEYLACFSKNKNTKKEIDIKNIIDKAYNTLL